MPRGSPPPPPSGRGSPGARWGRQEEAAALRRAQPARRCCCSALPPKRRKRKKKRKGKNWIERVCVLVGGLDCLASAFDQRARKKSPRSWRGASSRKEAPSGRCTGGRSGRRIPPALLPSQERSSPSSTAAEEGFATKNISPSSPAAGSCVLYI